MQLTLWFHIAKIPLEIHYFKLFFSKTVIAKSYNLRLNIHANCCLILTLTTLGTTKPQACYKTYLKH